MTAPLAEAWHLGRQCEQYKTAFSAAYPYNRKMAEDEAPKVKNYHPPKPYWRTAHTDWKFWVAVFFLFAALAIYIFSYDLVLVPH